MTKGSPAETANLVLLSLWLVKPTKTHIAFRFKLGIDPDTSGAGCARLLDRFQWIPDTTEPAFDTSDLQTAATYYRVLAAVNGAGGRLSDALVLTFSGCVARHWQVALVCFAAAVETVLTFDSSSGITKRLAKTYACLMESEPSRRDAAFIEFRKLYAVRSDVVHGRTGNIAAAERLPMLASFANIVRRLWRAVLQSHGLIPILEKADDQRRVYIETLYSGYVPPR